MEIKNLGQLIQHLATKAGIKTDDPNLVNILSNAELTKVTVHSDLVNAIDENLLHIDAALDQHPKVRAKYTAEVLNPFDNKMLAILEDLGVEDIKKDEFKGLKSTYKRFESVIGMIKDLKDAKAATTNNTDKQALQTKIDTLQNELRDAKAATITAKTEYEQKLNEDKLSYRLLNKFAGLKNTTLDQMPDDVRNSLFRELINKELLAKNAELRFDEKGDVQPFLKDGSKLYGANHTLTTLDSLIDSILAQNKLLKVSPANGKEIASGQNGQQQNHQNGQVIDLNGGQGQHKISGTNQAVLQSNLDAIKAFEEAGAQG